MKDNKFDIEELVIRYCEGNVSESEKCDVENWMSESEENSEIVPLNSQVKAGLAFSLQFLQDGV